MKKTLRKFYMVYLLTGLFVLFIFGNWIQSPVTLGGDFNFINYDHFKVMHTKPYIWDPSLGNGFGQYTLFTLPSFYYNFFTNKLTSSINEPFLLHKIIFLIPLLITSFFSILSLSRLVIKNKYAQAATIILYLINPYFMMLTSGGQIGVAFAYGFAPFVLGIFLKTLKEIKFDEEKVVNFQAIKRYFTCALSLAVLIALDSRIALIVFATIIFAYLGHLLISNKKAHIFADYTFFAIITILIILSFHAYWIIPSIFVQSVELPKGYASTESVEFFSFARLAHAITWSHPNYPDNMFGKVNEVVGTSFIFPLLAFAALIIKRKLIMYFASIAIISAFLIKGTNPPFGEIYNWMFTRIPAGSWFRDSTKFFLPLSISYAVLIGLTTQELIKIAPQKLKNLNKTQQKAMIGSMIAISIICIGIGWYPTLSRNLKGTLAYRTFPQNYNELKSILEEDNFGRVLWAPGREMYGFTSIKHPAVSLNELRTQSTCIEILCIPKTEKYEDESGNITFSFEDLQKEIDTKLSFLTLPDAPQILDELGIQYIVIPADIDKTIYIYDRKYDERIPELYQNTVSKLTYAQKIKEENGLYIYKLNKQTGLFKGAGNTSPIVLNYTMKSPVEYEISLPANTQSLFFSQSYDANWILYDEDMTLQPMASKTIGMIYPLTKTNERKVTLKYKGQTYADIGWEYSNISLIVIIALTLFLYTAAYKKKNI